MPEIRFPRSAASLILHCVVCAGLFSTAVLAEEPSDREPVVAIDHEPGHHLVLSTSTLRVFDAIFPPGAVSLWHRHEKDSVLLCLEGADVPSEEPGKPLQVRPPIPTGDIYYRAYAQKPFVHKIRNADTTRFRILDIEVLTPRRPDGPALDTLDDDGSVLIDNDRVRVWRLVVGARRAASPVRFQGGRLFVVMTDGDYAIETRGGLEQRRHVRRGDLRAMDGTGVEIIHNLAASALELVVIEVK
ncbi:hypothetical protein OOT46_20075 [Aquabacterium sp. A7-Y]|uniref:hypothetical protein n=1 Tax=Aquabacterium sp. A7-Y TaxID=1349605 RepID=UPI00223CB122|nr:hypothetical protein [Aquabacterium sp. A7-Y]MCW7540135.1 hypothetical protein [Aquabacterium sp. A7-Y]